MHKIEDIDNLHETLVCELGELSKKDKLSSADVELVDTLAHAAKNLEKVVEHFEEKEQGISLNSYGRSYGRPYYNSYGDGRMGRDGDGDGRYNEGRYGRGSYGNYGMSYGHDDKDRMVENFANMLNSASKDEKEDIIRKVMERF